MMRHKPEREGFIARSCPTDHPFTDGTCGPSKRRVGTRRRGTGSTRWVGCPMDRVERFRTVFHRMSEPNRHSRKQNGEVPQIPADGFRGMTILRIRVSRRKNRVK